MALDRPYGDFTPDPNLSGARSRIQPYAWEQANPRLLDPIFVDPEDYITEEMLLTRGQNQAEETARLFQRFAEAITMPLAKFVDTACRIAIVPIESRMGIYPLSDFAFARSVDYPRNWYREDMYQVTARVNEAVARQGLLTVPAYPQAGYN